ncbi:enoyl-CoA hydratase/isomerase family protein [Alcaligenaceae bacterium CGII-47]|nr:enoyl-CoA hydratase/isomerase family protein [Alcaligenaceae bacterium CGII-47]
MSEVVIFEELPSPSGHRIGIATLNRPQTLNGLSLEMCQALTQRLQTWKQDPTIAAILLRGAGDKVFCAGGDLHSLYRSMQQNTSGNPWENAYARQFFEVEYRLDHAIHTYPKPVICWGGGIVMGGGVGLMMGASHRVVTETTRFAMPEISIGLFPDVAGTWMLSRLPGGIGTFLALTGAQLGASDCLHLGLADHTCPAGGQEALLSALAAVSWSTDASAHAAQLDAVLRGLSTDLARAAGPLQQNFAMLREACHQSDFALVCETIAAWSTHPDPWLQRAARTFSTGAPSSARLAYTLLRRVRLMSLADVFREEYIVSLQCGVQGDFREGIRALLIDKDKSPKWNPGTHAQASAQWVERFFQTPWPIHTPHPLADL